MTEKEYKLIDRQYLEDEILEIIFTYLINENEKYKKVLKQLKHVDWREKQNQMVGSDK